MNKNTTLDQLGPIADEMLSGLHAGEAMKMRIKDAAQPQRRMRGRMHFVPAVCCTTVALVCVGAAARSLIAPEAASIGIIRGADHNQVVEIGTIAAGEGTAPGAVTMADLGEGAQVRAAAKAEASLFASSGDDIAMVSVGGAVYRMMETPKDMGASLCGEQLGTVSEFVDQPSLASAEALNAGISNVAGEGTAIYAVSGLSAKTAVAAQVDGKTRLFQRVSYAGKGPGKQSLEDTFGVRGKVKRLELSGVGVLEGDTANVVIGVLLDNAALKAADASMGKQKLTVTLSSGLKLQLGVSGDTVTGCGGWSCPEFFDAFEAAL